MSLNVSAQTGKRIVGQHLIGVGDLHELIISALTNDLLISLTRLEVIIATAANQGLLAAARVEKTVALTAFEQLSRRCHHRRHRYQCRRRAKSCQRPRRENRCRRPIDQVGACVGIKLVVAGDAVECAVSRTAVNGIIASAADDEIAVRNRHRSGRRWATIDGVVAGTAMNGIVDRSCHRWCHCRRHRR